ncbi:hypothetical protein THAOC_05020, partial [Thalassiosira oceanica]
MKFAARVIAAIFASSFASVDAADANGYTGSEYTFVGIGFCVTSPGLSAEHFAYGLVRTYFPPPFTLDECAAHCQGYPNIEGQVGFQNWISGNGRFECQCLYTDGTSHLSDTDENDLDHKTPTSSGPIGGTDPDHAAAAPPGGNVCYRRNAFGTPSKSPSMAPVTKSPSMTPTGSPTNGALHRKGHQRGFVATTGGAVPVTTGGAAILEDFLYYPDWTKSNGGCKTGGGQPT